MKFIVRNVLCFSKISNWQFAGKSVKSPDRTGSGSADTETNILEGTLSLLTSRRCSIYSREREKDWWEKRERDRLQKRFETV